MTEPRDPYVDVPPPDEPDGPQEPVDDSELEQEQHPTAPDEGRAANLYMRAG